MEGGVVMAEIGEPDRVVRRERDPVVPAVAPVPACQHLALSALAAQQTQPCVRHPPAALLSVRTCQSFSELSEF